MTTRTLTKTVTFRRPFLIGGFDEMLPAGEYCVETDEELLVGLSFSGYRRVLTVIRLPATSGNPDLTRSLSIDPAELEAALNRDLAASKVHDQHSVIQDRTGSKTFAGQPVRASASRSGN